MRYNNSNNCPGRIYIVRGFRHFRDFRNIFLLNMGEDQKSLIPSERRAPGTVPIINPALVIALRLKKD